MSDRHADDPLRSSSASPDPLPSPRSERPLPGLRAVVAALALSILGLVAALAGVGAAIAEDDRQWDRWGAIAAAAVLAIVAVVLIVAIRAIRQGGRTPRHSIEGIQAAIEIEPEVLRLVHFRTHHLGPEEILVAAKVEVLHDLTLADAAAVVNRIESNIRSNVSEVTAVFVETDVDESHRDSGQFVADTVGHINRHDPDYARLTGQVPVVAVVDPEDLDPETLDDEIWS